MLEDFACLDRHRNTPFQMQMDLAVVDVQNWARHVTDSGDHDMIIISTARPALQCVAFVAVSGAKRTIALPCPPRLTFRCSPGPVIAWNPVALTVMLSHADVRRNSLVCWCSSMVEHQCPNRSR